MVEFAEVSSSPVPCAVDLHACGAVGHIDDILSRHFVGVHAELAYGALERGPEHAEPAAQLCLEVIRCGVDTPLHSLLDEICEGLVADLGVLGLGTGHALQGGFGEPVFLGPVLPGSPCFDHVHQHAVLVLGEYIFQTQVASNIVEEYSPGITLGDVASNDVGVSVVHEGLGGVVHAD